MDEFMGIIKLFAGTFAPQGWMFCAGQILPISQYTALFSLLGTTYGGDGVKNFALPDLRSKVPVGAGQGAGLSNYTLGQVIGVESNTLLGANIPQFTATLQLPQQTGAATGALSTTAVAEVKIPCAAAGSDINAANNVIAGDGNTPIFSNSASAGQNLKPFNINVPVNINASLTVQMPASTVSAVINQGSSARPVSNIQPVLGLNYIICIVGIYPTRS